MEVAFWSPYHGQTGTTTTALTLASMVAMTNNYKVLLGHSHFQRSTLEKCLMQQRQLSEDLLSFNDQGLNALRRLAKNGRLVPEKVSDYTTPLLANNRLDLLQGIDGFNGNEISEEIQLLRRIFARADGAYDLVMVDVHSGLNQSLTRKILEDADVVVVCLNQNIWLLEEYFGHSEEGAMLTDKRIIYHISSYHKDSKYTLKNLKRRFNIETLIATPYSPELMDACSNGAGLDFYMRHIGGGKNDRFYPFMKELRQSVDRFLEALNQVGEGVTLA